MENTALPDGFTMTALICNSLRQFQTEEIITNLSNPY